MISGTWWWTRNCSWTVRGSTRGGRLAVSAGARPWSMPTVGSFASMTADHSSPPKKSSPARIASAATRGR